MIERRTRETRNDTGFALVEGLMSGFALVAFLALVGVVGAQMVIAIPTITDARHEARLTTLRSSLDNLAALQAIHYADTRTYADDLSTLGVREAEGIDITVEASPAGWTATAVARGPAGLESCTISVHAPREGHASGTPHPVCLD